jgi:hypothetical protein
MTEPGHTPAADVDMTPRAADIEIVERHYGEKKPAAGTNSVICPNHMRLNGVAVLATYDHPATIHEIELDGSSRSAFTVTVELLARAIAVGRAPTVEPRAEDTVRIRELVTDGPMHGAARVELKLLCRRLLVDDEPIAPASS